VTTLLLTLLRARGAPALFLLAIGGLALLGPAARAEEPAWSTPPVAAASLPAPIEPVPAPAAPPAAASSEYQVGAGDILRIEVYGEASLSGSFPVATDGGLDFPLLGRVSVGGLSPADVAAFLRLRLMAGYINSPNVTVSVATFHSQPVQVLGAVGKPGLYYLRGPTSVMQILSEAGGAAQQGVNEIRITRGGEGGQVVVLPYEQLLTGGTSDLALGTGDIVFVPQSLVTVIGKVGKPGEVAFRDGMTVANAIAGAGGAESTANLGRVYILRGDQRIEVNLRKVLAGKTPDVALQPGDRVYVPESAI
jgi:polysaccharide export outer membrane protein